jgi:tRNA(Ile)-lysidine synthase
MAMFELLRRFFPGRLEVAHLEHGFRGGPSLSDAAFVAEYCEKIGVRCFVRHGDVMNNRLPGESDEMAGRRVRYDFFFELLDSGGLPFVATAHNSGDLVETMLFNLFRGAGIKGLSGIAGRRGRVVRPVISCGRDDLRSFLSSSGIPWREDETNAENRYQRNRIRNQLLPWVRSNLNKSTDRVLLGLAGECLAADADDEEDSAGLLLWIKRRHPFALVSWDVAATRRLPPRRLSSVLRAQGRELSLPSLDRRRLDALRDLVATSGWRFQWANDVEVCGARNLIGWVRRAVLTQPPPVRVSLTNGERKIVEWGSWRFELILEPRGGGRARGRGVWSALIPAEESCLMTISSMADAVNVPAGDNQCFNADILREFPWWSRPGTPILHCAGEKINRSWIPGIFNGMQEDSNYVIIAKVFCCDKLAGKT